MAEMGEEEIDEDLGKNWAEIALKLNGTNSSDKSLTEECCVQQETASMKLKKEDITMYGLCPAWDEFYLAVCERCQLLVKPQALQKHIELRHYSSSQISNKINYSVLSKHNLHLSSSLCNGDKLPRQKLNRVLSNKPGAIHNTRQKLQSNQIENTVKPEISMPSLKKLISHNEPEIRTRPATRSMAAANAALNPATDSSVISTEDSAVKQSKQSSVVPRLTAACAPVIKNAESDRVSRSSGQVDVQTRNNKDKLPVFHIKSHSTSSSKPVKDSVSLTDSYVKLDVLVDNMATCCDDFTDDDEKGGLDSSMPSLELSAALDVLMEGDDARYPETPPPPLPPPLSSLDSPGSDVSTPRLTSGCFPPPLLPHSSVLDSPITCQSSNSITSPSLLLSFSPPPLLFAHSTDSPTELSPTKDRPSVINYSKPVLSVQQSVVEDITAVSIPLWLQSHLPAKLNSLAKSNSTTKTSVTTSQSAHVDDFKLNDSDKQSSSDTRALHSSGDTCAVTRPWYDMSSLLTSHNSSITAQSTMPASLSSHSTTPSLFSNIKSSSLSVSILSSSAPVNLSSTTVMISSRPSLSSILPLTTQSTSSSQSSNQSQVTSTISTVSSIGAAPPPLKTTTVELKFTPVPIKLETLPVIPSKKVEICSSSISTSQPLQVSCITSSVILNKSVTASADSRSAMFNSSLLVSSNINQSTNHIVSRSLSSCITSSTVSSRPQKPAVLKASDIISLLSRNDKSLTSPISFSSVLNLSTTSLTSETSASMPSVVEAVSSTTSVESVVSLPPPETVSEVVNVLKLPQIIPRVMLPTSKKKKKSLNHEKLLPCKDREYDTDKHCGVWSEELQGHCTRSFTCKTHALSLRRAVPGRSKPFDQLLLEQKQRKDAARLAALQESLADGSVSLLSIAGQPDQFLALVDGNVTLTSLKNVADIASIQKQTVGTVDSDALASIAASKGIKCSQKKSDTESHIQRGGVKRSADGKIVSSKNKNQVCGEMNGSRLMLNGLKSEERVLCEPPSPFISQSLCDIIKAEVAENDCDTDVIKHYHDDDDDDDDDDDMNDYINHSAFDSLPSSTYLHHHPRPLTVNGFGGWYHDKGSYVFNRREDHYRSALQSVIQIKPSLTQYSHVDRNQNITDQLIISTNQNPRNNSLSNSLSTSLLPAHYINSSCHATSTGASATNSVISYAVPAKKSSTNSRARQKSTTQNQPPSSPSVDRSSASCLSAGLDDISLKSDSVFLPYSASSLDVFDDGALWNCNSVDCNLGELLSEEISDDIGMVNNAMGLAKNNVCSDNMGVDNDNLGMANNNMGGVNNNVGVANGDVEVVDNVLRISSKPSVSLALQNSNQTFKTLVDSNSNSFMHCSNTLTNSVVPDTHLVKCESSAISLLNNQNIVGTDAAATDLTSLAGSVKQQNISSAKLIHTESLTNGTVLKAAQNFVTDFSNSAQLQKKSVAQENFNSDLNSDVRASTAYYNRHTKFSAPVAHSSLLRNGLTYDDDDAGSCALDFSLNRQAVNSVNTPNLEPNYYKASRNGHADYMQKCSEIKQIPPTPVEGMLTKSKNSLKIKQIQKIIYKLTDYVS